MAMSRSDKIRLTIGVVGFAAIGAALALPLAVVSDRVWLVGIGAAIGVWFAWVVRDD